MWVISARWKSSVHIRILVSVSCYLANPFRQLYRNRAPKATTITLRHEYRPQEPAIRIALDQSPFDITLEFGAENNVQCSDEIAGAMLLGRVMSLLDMLKP